MRRRRKEVEVVYGRETKGVQRARQSRRARLLEHGDSVYVPGAAGRAEEGAALWSEGAAGVHGRRHPELDAFHKLGISATCPRRECITPRVNLDQATNIGDYNLRSSPEEPILVRMLRTPCQPGLAGARPTARRALRPAGDVVRNVRAKYPRPTGARAGRWRVRSRARHRRDHGEPLAARLRVRIQPAVGSRIGPRDSVRATSPASALGASRLPTPMPRPPPTPIRRSIRLFVLCRNCFRSREASERQTHDHPEYGFFRTCRGGVAA